MHTSTYFIASAREARDLTARLTESKRSKSETYLLDRHRSRSCNMLFDEVSMDDIDCHQSFRRKLRATLGLENTSMIDNSNNTSTDNLSKCLHMHGATISLSYNCKITYDCADMFNRKPEKVARLGCWNCCLSIQ